MFYKLIWKVFGSGLLPYYLKDQNKPTTHTKLEYAFTDQSGKKYYRFPEGVSLSIERYGHLTKYITLLSARLTPENMDKILDKMLEIIQAGIGKDKNAAKVAALVYELKDRDKWIVPAQLVYDILAVQYIREDENPSKFDNQIHKEKVSTFIDDISKSEFFFQLPELKKLISSTLMSHEDWEKYCQESGLQNQKIESILRTIS